MTWLAELMGNKEDASLWREKAKTAAVKKSQGIQRLTKAYLSNSIRKSGQLERCSLDSSGIPLSFPKVHTYTHTHTETHIRWLFSTACQLYLFNPDQWVLLHQGPVPAPVINMWVPLYQLRLQINQRVGHRRKGANISSITPERHHGEMQIASQETPGDVKEKLVGRQREANEYNGKCIQGRGENPLFIPINTILSMEV